MKLGKIIEKFGLPEKHLEDVEIGVEHVIVHREFKRTARFGTQTDFRVRAVESMLEKRVSFRSEENTFREVAVRVMQFNCPYCFKTIKAEFAGGSPQSYSMAGECKLCKVRVSFSAPPNAFSVTIKDEE